MKLLTMTLAGLFVLTCAPAKADVSTTPVVPSAIPVAFDKVYTPKGFDDNDNVQIVGEGRFQHTCYRHAQTTAAVDHANKVIHLSPVAYLYPGLCLQLTLPFDRTIDVGLLEQGDWKITQLDNQVVGQIHINHSQHPDQPDDYLYAPISQAFFHSENGQNEIYITGNMVSSCMSLQNVRVDVQSDVIVVQPIAQMEAGASCVEGQFHFEKTIKLNLMRSGRYLLHVRSMNGNAINTLVDVF